MGNVDSLTVDGVTVANPDGVTSADVTGNTNILIRGGEAKVTSLWNESGRCWTEAKLVKKMRTNGRTSISLPAGIYVVVSGNHSKKVIIK